MNMKSKSLLKICVLGGRNFGKTSLLSSLILISGDEKSGITVSGDNLKKLNIYNDYKNNSGKLIATNWDDICQFRYNLTGNGNQKYKLTFVDYPGEFFQKFFSDSEGFSTKFLSLFGLRHKESQETTDEKRLFTKNEAKLARRLVSELESADAFIMLLPADVTKDDYKVNLQVFKTQLQALLEKIHRIKPYIPVCLAINKWDMFGKPYDELAEILQTKPYKDFDNMLRLECGEHYFCQAISAFGKNRSKEAKNKQQQEELKEEWDRKSEPVNVMQMLLKISEEAENSRYLHLREKYSQSRIVAKILQFPWIFARHYRLGANSENNRKFCVSGLVRSFSEFAITIASIIVMCLLTTVLLTTIGEFTYLKINEREIAEIEKSLAASKTDNTSPERIYSLKDKLLGHPLKFAFLCRSKTDRLNARVTDIEKQYNKRVWNNAVSFCNDKRHCDEPATELKSEERKSRCQERITHLENESKKITDLLTRCDDGRSVKDCFSAKIEDEKRLLANIGKDGELDDALYILGAIKPEGKCQYIETLIDQYESTYSYRKDDFEKLKDELKTLEEKYHDELLSDLETIKDIENSKDYSLRIDLASKRISRIEQEAAHLSQRSPWLAKNQETIEYENQNISNWTHDNIFYSAFNSVINSPDDGKIQRLIDFLQKYPKESYPRCVADWDIANSLKEQLIGNVNRKLQAILNDNRVTVSGITAIEREQRLANSIAAYQEALKDNPTERTKYNEAITALEIALQAANKDSEFEEEYNKVRDSADEGKLIRIHNFLSGGKFAQANFPGKSKEYEELEQEEKRLLEKWQKNKEENCQKYADDPKQSRAKRLEQAGKLLAEHKKLLNEYLPASQEYNDTLREISDLTTQIAEHKKYNELIHEINKIEELSDKFRIVNAIAEFEESESIISGNYPDKDGIEAFRKLQNLKKENTTKIMEEFNSAENNILKPDDSEFSKLAIYYQDLTQNTNNYMQKLSPSIPFYKDLENKTITYSNLKKKNLLYSQIDGDLHPLIENDGQMSIEVAKDRLRAIKSFYSNEHFCSELNSAPELSALSTRLKTIQTGVENYIGNYMNRELENLKKALPQGATAEQQIPNWKRQLEFIDDNCAIMIQSDDNPLYRNFNTRRKDLRTRLGKAELEDRFKKDSIALERNLSITQDLTEKIAAINDFINRYNDYDDLKENLQTFKIQKNNLIQENEFSSFEHACRDLIDNKPSSTAQGFVLSTYRDNVNDRLSDLSKYQNVSIVLSRVDRLRSLLNAELEYVKKAIGDGSWTDILTKETAYKTNPCKATYDSLQNAIRQFDKTQFSSYEDKVKEVERNSKEDNRLAQNVEEAVSRYKNDPNHNNFITFRNSIQDLYKWIHGQGNQVGYNSNHTMLSKYNNYITSIESGVSIWVSCSSASFGGSWKRVDYTLSCGQQTIVGSYYKDTGRVTGQKEGGIKLQFENPLVCEFTFVNIASYDKKTISINFWQIIKDGNYSQTFRGSVKEVFMGFGGTYDASLTFSISGVPEL